MPPNLDLPSLQTQIRQTRKSRQRLPRPHPPVRFIFSLEKFEPPDRRRGLPGNFPELTPLTRTSSPTEILRKKDSP